MARKRQRKKKIKSQNLTVPFTRPHSPKIKPNKTRKGQRREAKLIEE